ncbi:MAG: hypothetical protein LBR74_04880 [Eubacterium sp.]|jgi:hypothetical protein|nr:hypothetical protein [Eubacterium sp.]
MAKANTADKNLLVQIERYCNNYFNSTNTPDNAERNYPSDFLALVSEIAEFKTRLPNRKEIISEMLDDYSVTYNGNTNSWQKAFAQELSIYKRVKFI